MSSKSVESSSRSAFVASTKMPVNLVIGAAFFNMFMIMTTPSLTRNTITGESTGKEVLLHLFLGFGPLLLLLAFNWLSPYPKLVVSAESLEYLTWTNRLSTAWENIATIGLMPAFIGGSEHEGAVLSQPGTQGSKLPLGLGLARSWRARFIPLSIFGWWRYHDLGQQIARHAPWLLQSPLRDRTETPILDKNPKTEECPLV